MIVTQRLLLRPLTHDDAESFATIWSDPQVIWWGAKAPTECRAFLAEVIDRTRGHPDLAWFAVIRKSDRRLIADVPLEPAAWDPSLVEIGWHVARDAQGQGYATEAALGVTDYARSRGRTHLEASIVPSNEPSRRVAAKLGMTPEYRIVRAGLDHEVWVLDLA